MNLKDLKQHEKDFYRAPSAHNTQPWALDYQENAVHLSFHQDRALIHGDPTYRDLLLAMGAFVETFLIVSSEAGCPVEFIPEIDLNKRYVGFFRVARENYRSPFKTEDVRKRQTSRLIYENVSLSAETLLELNKISGDFKLHVVNSVDLLDLFRKSERYVYGSKEIVDELQCWLRLSKLDPRYFKDGLNAECLNLGPFQARMFGLLLKFLQTRVGKALGIEKLLTLLSQDVLVHSCPVLVLTGEDGKDATLQAGRILQKIWLVLAQGAYYTHPLSQIIDCPLTYSELHKSLSLSEKQKMYSVFRVGKSSKPAYSWRVINEEGH